MENCITEFEIICYFDQSERWKSKQNYANWPIPTAEILKNRFYFIINKTLKNGFKIPEFFPSIDVVEYLWWEKSVSAFVLRNSLFYYRILQTLCFNRASVIIWTDDVFGIIFLISFFLRKVNQTLIKKTLTHKKTGAEELWCR